ncbi:MAG: adenine-specific methyltransferase EcoRI family protein [Candidatus Saccharimonadales bacterium]
MANSNLGAAKKAKNDEFYTQFTDIQKEIEAYLEYDPDTFRGKVVYCNCDDPFESNFFRFFTLNFKRLKLKRLITTSYKPSPIDETQLVLTGFDEQIETKPPLKGRPKTQAKRFIINDVGDYDGDGAFRNEDIAKQLRANRNNEWKPLKGDGDFRSPECIELLKQADIVVTNPPFSLFREYIKQLIDHDKKFCIIGNMNAITYKEIFPLIRENKLWVGSRFNKRVNGKNMTFRVPDTYPMHGTEVYKDEEGNKFVSVAGTGWFTNLDHGRRHQPLGLMTMADNLKFNKKMAGKEGYDKYVNYEAIEVPFTDAIPSDYDGEMGVPISFLDKYNPDQFEIVGISLLLASPMSSVAAKGTYQQGGRRFYTANTDGTYNRLYDRIVIKHRKASA